MKICENGICRDMTPEEIATRSKDAALAAIAERSRPLTAQEVSRMLLAQQVNTLQVDDNTALRMTEYYPHWESGMDYTLGYKVRHNSKLWRTLQAHTSQSGWEPENAAALWEQVCPSYSGAIDDPIPYDGNMRLEQDKHYIQDDVIYLCNRDTVNPVYHALADLLGLYVEVIT